MSKLVTHILILMFNLFRICLRIKIEEQILKKNFVLHCDMGLIPGPIIGMSILKKITNEDLLEGKSGASSRGNSSSNGVC